MTTGSTQPGDNSKLTSGLFQEMKINLANLAKADPEIFEYAIKKRNIKLKCLEAEKSHMLIAYNEISKRYDDITTELDLYKGKKTDFEKLKKDKENLDILLAQSYKISRTQQDEIYKLKHEKEKLQLTYEKVYNEFGKLKTDIIVERELENNTILNRFRALIEKIPNRFIRSIFKFLVSQQVISYSVFLLFCILFIASFIGWGQIIAIIKGFILIAS